MEHDSNKVNDTIKLLPFMFSDKNKIFCFKDCTFAMEKEKENTARIVLFREIGILNCYTLESTFYGSDALGKVAFDTDSSSEEESIEGDFDREDTKDYKNKDKIKFQKESKSEPVQENQNINSEGITEDSITQIVAHSNKFEIKLPLLGPAQLEKRTIVNSKRRKSKIVGDIHVTTNNLIEVGADLCRTLFSFFNESIKLRKLQSLRKIRMKFSRTKTCINNRIDNKIKEKSPESNSKINTLKLINKVLLMPAKCKIEESKAINDICLNDPVKLAEIFPINEQNTENKSQYSEMFENRSSYLQSNSQTKRIQEKQKNTETRGSTEFDLNKSKVQADSAAEAYSNQNNSNIEIINAGSIKLDQTNKPQSVTSRGSKVFSGRNIRHNSKELERISLEEK